MSFVGMRMGCVTRCCEAGGCDCADNYDTPGIGGLNVNRSCPFTNGDDLEVADGVLYIEDRTITYSGGPDNVIDTVHVTVVIKPTTSSGPASLMVRVAINGVLYAYAKVDVTGDEVTLSIGTSSGELQSQIIGTEGIDDFITLEVCFKPPVILEEDVLFGIGIQPYQVTGSFHFGTPSASIVEDGDAGEGTNSSLGEEDTASLAAGFYRPIPDDAELVGFAAQVKCREAADPGNGIIDSSAVLQMGLTAGDDYAFNDPIPAMAFGFGTLGYGGPDDLWGELSVDTADYNQNGAIFGISFFCPLGTGGGTQVDVDAIALGVFYLQDITQPGQLSAQVSTGGLSGCLHEGIKGVIFGGGNTGITAVGGWEVDNYSRTCDQEDCTFCLPPVDCVNSCCNEDDPVDFEAQQIVEGFDDTETLPDTTGPVLTYGFDSFTLTHVVIPAASGDSCVWYGGSNSEWLSMLGGTVVQDPSDPGSNIAGPGPEGEPIIGISASIFVDFNESEEGGISCFWQVAVQYRYKPPEGSGDTGYMGYAVYRSPITANDPPEDLAGDCASALPVTVLKYYEPDLADMPGIGNSLPAGYDQLILPDFLNLDWAP